MGTTDGVAEFHKSEDGCILPGLGRDKHCPEFGQVARNSLGIHGVVSKIPGLLHHPRGSGLFSVLYETVPCGWDRYSVNHTLMEPEHSRQPHLIGRHQPVHSHSEEHLDSLEDVALTLQNEE